VLKNWLRSTGLDRVIFVTDAISAARLGPGRYTLAGWDILIGEDLVARSPDGSHFVGSTVTVPRIKANALHDLGMTEAELARVLDENPRKAMAA
jgi:N-acetylglucosamine-6-phosphate deacetylase